MSKQTQDHIVDVNNMVTAVEWLEKELTEVNRNLINKTFLQLNKSLAGHILKDIFEQAKEMEKQKMFNFAIWYSGMEEIKVQKAYERYLIETNK